MTFALCGMRCSRVAPSTIRMASQLVHIPEVERLSPICIRILGGNPGKFTLQGTNTYLVGSGPDRLLIDTGEGKPSWISALRRTLEEEGASVQAAIITHWHRDHVGGIGQLLEHSPGTAVYKHDPGAEGGHHHHQQQQQQQQQCRFDDLQKSACSPEKIPSVRDSQLPTYICS